MESYQVNEVIVIGGGIAGVSAALELAKKSSVILIEKKHLFWGSSGRNPGRMGHGFHYMDFETAKMYLHASVAVQRNYPDFLIGKDLPFDDPIRHGRYFITKNSLYSFEQVMESYTLLQQEYTAMVKQDPANEVFGPPEKFLRVLDVSEYADYVNLEAVEGAVETAEHLFNWPEFSEYIRRVIEIHPRITLYENTEVTHIHPRVSRAWRFQIEAQTTSSETSEQVKHTFKTNYIVNSSWENIDLLNETAGVTYINRMRTNRLKCLLEVKLPKTLHHVNSSFFCMGSFCMFSNMGDGRGMMTLADVTNMASSFTKEIDANMKRYVNGDVSLEEKSSIAKEILDGVSYYIPDMAGAEFIDVKFGIVQTKGELNLSDLLDKKAAHHVRNYHGIREEYQGLISNPAMKLFYFIDNAHMVSEFFKTQIERELIHQQVFQILSKTYIWNLTNNRNFMNTIYFIVDRMMLNKDEDPQKVVDCMTAVARAKFIFHTHIHVLKDISETLLKSRALLNIEDEEEDDSFDICHHFPAAEKKAVGFFDKLKPLPMMRSISCDWSSPKYRLFHDSDICQRPKSASACYESGYEECKVTGISHHSNLRAVNQK